MRRHRVRYIDAKRVINQSRQALGMTRIEPWNEALQLECERRLLGSKSDLQVRMTVIEDTINEDKAVVPELKVFPKVEPLKLVIAPDLSEHDETEPETDESSRQEDDDHTSEASNDESRSVEDEDDDSADGESSVHSNKENSSESSEEKTQDEEEKSKSEGEELADDCSQATDNSKCFTTAEEVGIVLTEDTPQCFTDSLDFADFTKPREDIPEEKTPEEETPEEKDNDHMLECAPLLKTQERSTLVYSKTGDSHTVDTGVESEEGIPLFIIIDKRRPPEVPRDEPLGECFNIPAKVKGPRAARLSYKKLIKRLRRFTTIRKRTRLREDDTEVFRQTLVDI